MTSAAVGCEAAGRSGRDGAGIVLALGDLDLLGSGLVGGIDLQGAGELVERAGEVAVLAQDAAAIDVLGGGLEAHAVDARGVAHVLGRLQVGLEVILVGGVVVLAEFGGLRRACSMCWRSGRGRQEGGCCEEKDSAARHPRRQTGEC